MNYTTSSHNHSGSGLSAGAVVGIVFALIAFLIVTGLIIYFMVLKPRRSGGGAFSSRGGGYSPANTAVNTDEDDDAMLVAE